MFDHSHHQAIPEGLLKKKKDISIYSIKSTPVMYDFFNQNIRGVEKIFENVVKLIKLRKMLRQLGNSLLCSKNAPRPSLFNAFGSRPKSNPL